MRFPNPPVGIESCPGKNLSKLSRLIVTLLDDAYEMINVPSFLARNAGMFSKKNIQACAPFPERDFSIDTLMFIFDAAFLYSMMSSFQVFLSKSAARNMHVSSCFMAYVPMVTFPSRCARMTSSFRG